jgi:hypothetical protein
MQDPALNSGWETFMVMVPFLVMLAFAIFDWIRSLPSPSPSREPELGEATGPAGATSVGNPSFAIPTDSVGTGRQRGAAAGRLTGMVHLAAKGTD